MDAIALLKKQHRDVEELFDQFEESGERAKKKRAELCAKISDALAVHATIEEKIFYPASKSARTEELLHEAVEEHLSAKRLIADLMECSPEDPQFAAKVTVLKEQIDHHVEEEEQDLFPKAKKELGAERLDELGEEMMRMVEELQEGGEPRKAVPGETDHAAPI